MAEFEYEIRDGVGWFTFNRPEARNALTFGMYEALAEVCRGLTLGGDVRALVVQGAGDKAFAAGTDMRQFLEFSSASDATGYETRMEGVIGDVERCPVPTIAAITGACTGGGAALAAACDIRITDTRLKFGFPIARTLGNCLSAANLHRIASLIGRGRTAEIMLTARLVGAEEALAVGLVSEVLDDPAAVRARAAEIAETLKGHAPLTMRATKETLRRLRNDGPEAEDEDIITATYMSADFKEGMDAFLNKRAPNWTGS